MADRRLLSTKHKDEDEDGEHDEIARLYVCMSWEDNRHGLMIIMNNGSGAIEQ